MARSRVCARARRGGLKGTAVYMGPTGFKVSPAARVKLLFGSPAPSESAKPPRIGGGKPDSRPTKNQRNGNGRSNATGGASSRGHSAWSRLHSDDICIFSKGNVGQWELVSGAEVNLIEGYAILPAVTELSSYLTQMDFQEAGLESLDGAALAVCFVLFSLVVCALACVACDKRAKPNVKTMPREEREALYESGRGREDDDDDL